MKPSFIINNNMLNKIVEISKLIGSLEYQEKRNLKLRKENRIKSIHSSLAIENNKLTVEQITDIIDGKRVLGSPKEIKEVKNAYEAYEEIMNLNPYSQKDFLYAHKLLTKGIVNTSGQYRYKDVGIFDGDGNGVYMGARPQFIHSLMDDLFNWGQIDDTPELIKSCVFHYEIETIHPYEDGNGRMGRLWQSVILSNWNPIFAWIPIETIVHEHQDAYYQELALADSTNDSSRFIEFMLDIILETLNEYKSSDEISDVEFDKIYDGLSLTENSALSLLIKYLSEHKIITTTMASELLGKAIPTTRRYLAKFVEIGVLEKSGENKNRVYSLKE